MPGTWQMGSSAASGSWSNTSSNVAFLQTGKQRTGLDDFGARGIDQHCAGLEMSKVFSGDNATSGIIQRQMDGNNITGFDKLIEIVDRNGTRPFKMLGRHM